MAQSTGVSGQEEAGSKEDLSRESEDLMARGKIEKVYRGLQSSFGSEVGFRFARIAKGCITHGRYFKRGDPHVEMDQKTFDKLVESGAVSESREPGCYFLSG